jgi:hypothetical protein
MSPTAGARSWSGAGGGGARSWANGSDGWVSSSTEDDFDDDDIELSVRKEREEKLPLAAYAISSLETGSLAEATEGDRLVGALWAKVLGRPLPNKENPDDFFSALSKRYERVVTDLYGMSEVKARPAVRYGAAAGYGTSLSSLRGAVAKSVQAKVVECVSLLQSFTALPKECCVDPARSRALIPTMVDEMRRLPSLVQFKDGLTKVSETIHHIGIVEGGEIRSKSLLAQLREIYRLDTSEAWTIEETNAATQFQDLTWKLQEILTLARSDTGIDLYTISAAFQNVTARVQQIRNDFDRCGVSPSSFKLPITDELDEPIGGETTFEEVLAAIEYQTSPAVIDGGALAVLDHRHELDRAVELIKKARIKSLPDAAHGPDAERAGIAGHWDDKRAIRIGVDPKDPCLPQCYVDARRQIEALYCAADDCRTLVTKFKVGSPPTCDLCFAHRFGDTHIVELYGRLGEVTEVALVRGDDRPLVSHKCHTSNSGDYVRAMFDYVPEDILAYKVRIGTRHGHVQEFDFDQRAIVAEPADVVVPEPTQVDACTAQKSGDTHIVELYGQLGDVTEVALVKGDDSAIVSARRHTSSSGEYVRAMFEDLPEDILAYKVRIRTRYGHVKEFGFDHVTVDPKPAEAGVPAPADVSVPAPVDVSAVDPADVSVPAPVDVSAVDPAGSAVPDPVAPKPAPAIPTDPRKRVSGGPKRRLK